MTQQNLLEYAKYCQKYLNENPNIDFAKVFVNLRSFAFNQYHDGIIISNSHGLSYFDNVIKYWDNPDSYYTPDKDFKLNNYIKQKYLDNYEYNFILILKKNKNEQRL